MTKLSRRHFFNYASHTLVAAALWRTFQSTRAFGAEGRKKILICTNPNGHHNSQDTAAALQMGLGSKAKAQTAILQGLDFEVTRAHGDWHAGEMSLLSFSKDQKSRVPSFFTSLGLSNNDIKYLGIDVGNRHYAIDSAGNPINAIEDPSLAMRSFFGRSLQSVNSYDLALIESGRKNMLDPCLDDVKRLRSLLGQDKELFDNYLHHLQNHYAEIVKQEEAKNGNNGSDGGGNDGGGNPSDPGNSNGGGGAGEPGSRFEAATCNKNAPLSGGSSVEAKHEDMLEVAYQLMACDMAQVVVVSFLNNNTDPQHNLIHGNGGQDGGASFKAFTSGVQSRVAKLANRLSEGDYNILDRSAVVYMSEGGAHADSPSGGFSTGHPTANIPCAVYGSLGGAISKSGIINVNGQTNRNLWRQLADGMSASGKADLSAIGGDGISPIGI
ncbi:DUF1552 domain-containing protein [Pseudobacteriovorax antillogorgiicola]|uniref:DUF1552 domain-containing protein n=1 Tax=Pseudobacteriovorax antillogorgiicola TaxID=1513793 RepID=A0A1Y6B9V8_9BACT|nr:DUF1552 domain-containing protein [Pseudobacteriovorax antillogorgiicola]TCS57476.1 uncharacterized protein DUF1552 [Pseudobacteriovorax antillogorgiicola]SMF00574.1 Protein of unknown function [Pseudobacteriovorax antillogorgiicola]